MFTNKWNQLYLSDSKSRILEPSPQGLISSSIICFWQIKLKPIKIQIKISCVMCSKPIWQVLYQINLTSISTFAFIRFDFKKVKNWHEKIFFCLSLNYLIKSFSVAILISWSNKIKVTMILMFTGLKKSPKPKSPKHYPKNCPTNSPKNCINQLFQGVFFLVFF